jgi:hypothetical protein
MDNFLEVKMLRFMSLLKKRIDTHCALVNETYKEHLLFTCSIGFRLFITSVIVIIHGLLPCFFTYTASNQIKKIHQIMNDRIKSNS